MDKDSSSHAKPNNKTGKELLETQVFIIDEISMVPKYALEILDRKLRELTNIKKPFGGKLFITGGDFRQILPIESKAGRTELINLSIRRSKLWKHFKNNIFELKENKRVTTTDQINNEDFADFLLKMGNGELKSDENENIEIPEKMIAKTDLIDEIFGDDIHNGNLIEAAKKVILTITNDKNLEINNKILDGLETMGHELKTYYSIDKVDSDEPVNYVEYPEEFLNSLNEGGLPPHHLRLAKNVPVMLLRNLNPSAGLCNGTRMLVKEMHRNHLECEILVGEKKGNLVLIPKLKLTSSKAKFPFTLYRKQFPVKPCYSMTINKSQGQTIDYVGIDLEDPVFSHGMTYVAFSRARSWDKVKVSVKPGSDNKVKNIVWKEVLSNSKK